MNVVDIIKHNTYEYVNQEVTDIINFLVEIEVDMEIYDLVKNRLPGGYIHVELFRGT